MNKKGFTLVEVLAVVVLLAIIMIIVVPNAFETLNAGKNKISDIDKKQLSDAAETAVLEAINSDMTSADYDYIFNANSCEDLNRKIVGKEIKTTIEKLKNQYSNLTIPNNCEGEVVIKTNTKKTITITAKKCNNTTFKSNVKNKIKPFINNCNDSNKLNNCNTFNKLFVPSISDIKNGLLVNNLETTVAKLKEKGHFNDISNKCDGSLEINVNTNYKVTVKTEQVNCG